MTFKKIIGIDLGTDSVQFYLRGAGIVCDEPSIVAFNNRTNRVIAVGSDAKKMLARTPTHITALHPIQHGIVADFEMAREMLQRFLKNKRLPWSWMTEVVLSVPTSLTEVERKSFEDLVKEAGANKVHLVEQPLLAALGSGLNIYQPTAYLVIDIGAGTTDMAIISMNGIVVSKRLKIAGNYLNSEIMRAVREELKLNIGEPTAEDIKLGVGSAVPQNDRLEITIRGRDVTTGLPKEISVKDVQVRNWLVRPLKFTIESLKNLVEETPAELVGDVYKNGIYVCGGGSLLRNVDQMIQKEIGVGVRIVEDPLRCVARGLGMIADDPQAYAHLFNNFSGVVISA